MVKEVLDALIPIKEATGLEIDLYTALGELLLSTGEGMPEYNFVYHNPSEFVGGTVTDLSADVTYFLVKKQSVHYVGAILGTSEVSRNYAVMVAKIIESTMLSAGENLDKTDKFRMLLSGELNEAQVSSLKNSLPDSFNFYVLLLIADSSSKVNELKNFLPAVSEKNDIIVPMDHHTIAYIKECGDEDEYQSANDFASILYDNVKEELRINLVISVGGPVHRFGDLVSVYQHAVFAYELGKLMDPSGTIYSYKEYVLIKLLSDIPKGTLKQYLDMLLDKSYLEILSDDELMNTADVFLKNSLNISETSRSMYMHRNTLIYRLDKIEKATGLNIRHFNDAVTFRLITIFGKLVGREKK